MDGRIKSAHDGLRVVSATPGRYSFSPLPNGCDAPILRALFQQGVRVVPREIATEAVLNDAELLGEAAPLARVPGTPFAFIWFLIARHFPGRVAAMAGCALFATSIEAFYPVAFSHLVNAITAAVKHHGGFDA